MKKRISRKRLDCNLKLSEKNQGPYDFTGKFYRTFKEFPPILKLFSKKTKKGTLPNSFYEGSILVPKPEKDTTINKIIDQYPL